MMNDTAKYLRDSLATSTGRGDIVTNAPPQYDTQRKHYMSQQTRDFISTRAEYASDVTYAECQGIDLNNWYEFVETDVRFSDVASQTSSKININDDTKEVLFFESFIEYFPLGAKLRTCGSTWICINPSNISSAYSTAVVKRCNTSYNSYDDYGNVITEPIIIDAYPMTGNQNLFPDNMVLMHGNFRVICQLNDNTRKLDINKRIILGKKAYYITGFTDFTQEFSGDRDSSHLLTFTVRLEEPTKADDISEDFVADADDYIFGAEISGQTELKVGQNASFNAIFTLNGSAVTDKPVDWMWQSSDEDTAFVDDMGNVIALRNGKCEIRAVLRQNPSISTEVEITITEAPKSPYIQFVGVVAKSVSQYFSESYTAVYFDENGQESDVEIEWGVTSVSTDCYDFVVSGDSKTATITCLKSSETPLILTASHGNAHTSVSVELYGY